MTWLSLLAYLWEISPGTLAWGLVAAASAVALGFALLWFSGRRPWLFPLGAAVAFLGLAVGYALVCPPFHAPDEPDHFWGFLAENGRYELIDETRRLAARGHFSEIAFHPHVPFREEWVGRPSEQSFTDNIDVVIMRERAPLVARLWNLVSTHLMSRGASGLLMELRLWNALLVSGMLGVALCVVTALAESRGPSNRSRRLLMAGSLVVLFVPALPFFSMHVSNYSVLISGGLLGISASLAPLFLRSRPVWTGFVLGIAVFFLAFSGRSGLVFSIVVTLSAIVASLFRLERNGRRPLSVLRTLIFPSLEYWFFFALGWMGGWFLFGKLPLFEASLLGKGELPRSVHHLVAAQTSNPFCLMAFLPCLGAVCEICSLPFRALRGRGWIRHALALPGIWVAAGGVVAVFLGKRLHLASIEVPNPPGAAQYVLRVLGAFWGSLSLGRADPYLSRSFWLGFGWLDVLPPGSVFTMFLVPVFLGTVWLWWRAWGRRSLSGLSQMAAWSGIWVGYLVILALAASRLRYNLHGRYLILFYLIFLPVGFAGFGELCRFLFERFRTISKRNVFFKVMRNLTPWHILLGLCALGHSYAFALVIRRYF